jgi:hypothetical protein
MAEFTHFSLVIEELIEFNVESKSAKLLVDPLQLFEYLSRVVPRFVLLKNAKSLLSGWA